MNKIYVTSLTLTVTSCLAEIQNGEFAIKLINNDIKDNFEKTIKTLNGNSDLPLTVYPEEGEYKDYNRVHFSIKKDKIMLLDSKNNDDDKYDFYKTYIKDYVNIEEKFHSKYDFMNNKHVITDIKTCKIEINIPEDYINNFTYLKERIDDLKKDLFNNKDYGFLIFKDDYSGYIKEHHYSFNTEFKDGKFIITANKEYVENNDILKQHDYTIKVFIDPNKKKDYVINDKYKDYNLKNVEFYTSSIGNKKSADNLIEDFKKSENYFNIQCYELCDAKGNKIIGNKLPAGTYYVKNDSFFTKKTNLKLYNTFLKNQNDKLVNGVEELISKDTIDEKDFKEKMTDIYKIFEEFSNEESGAYKKYKDLFEDSYYGEIINNKFKYLNDLRRKLMAMYLYKNVIANVNSIINKLQNNNFSDLNIDLFFNNNWQVIDYANNFIYGIYEKFKKDFIKYFYINGKYYDNDVKENNKDYYDAFGNEIRALIGNQEYENYKELSKKLIDLLEKKKDNLLTKYEIKADTTKLTESDEGILKELINEINDITKKVLYRKKGSNLSYKSLLKNLKLYQVFYTECDKHRVLFFDIFVDDEKIVFNYTKELKDLLSKTLPEGKHTIFLKFYDCVKSYNYLDEEDFYKLLIAQIGRKDYQEKEIEKINNITSLSELNKNYKEILNYKDKYNFYDKIKCIQEPNITSFKYYHSKEGDENFISFSNLPNIYNAVATKLQQLEKVGMCENERKGVEEIENKYKCLVDLIIQEINSTETLEKLKELPYSKKEDIKKDLENKVKSDVDDYDNKKSKITEFDIFVNSHVEHVYNAYNTKYSGIIKDEEEKKIKAAEEEEKRKKEEEDKKKKNGKDNTAQTSTEDDTDNQQQSNKKPCCKCYKK